MSQHKLTDIELDTFARYLWEYGDKRKLEAFRATFPDSKAADRSASTIGGRIYDLHKVDILLIIERLQVAAAEHSTQIGMGIEQRQKFYANLVNLASRAIESQSTDTPSCSKDLIGFSRNALTACDQMNKLSGSYAPVKGEETITHTQVEFTRVAIPPTKYKEHDRVAT